MKVVRPRLASMFTFILGAIFLLIISPPAGFPGEGDITGHVESDDMEMSIQRSGKGANWHAADRDMKLRFENAYHSARNKRQVFEESLDTLGPEAMLDFLELNNPRCHGEAHDLGKAVFAHLNDIGAALNICGNRCTNACMHGVVSEVFGYKANEEITEYMTRFCERGEMAVLHKAGNCAHGIGHALMIHSEHDIGKALAGCAAFPKAGMDYYCATGVFMEYRGMLRYHEQHGEKVHRPRLHFPCDTYTQFPAACYRYMLRRIADELNADSPRLIEECLGLAGRQKRGCFHGLGAMYSRTVAKKPDLLPDLCLQGDAEDQIMCIEGVIEKMADFNEERAMSVCAALTGENARVCTAGAREKMYRLNKPTMKLYRGT